MLATFNEDEQRMHETFQQFHQTLTGRAARYKSTHASSDSDFEDGQGSHEARWVQQQRKYISERVPKKALPSIRYSSLDAETGGREGQRMRDKL